MNSPVRSLDKPKNHAAYLRFGLKQNWQQLVFYTIVMLLACVVTSIIGTASTLENIRNGYSMYYTPAEQGAELFRDIALIFAVVSCVLGVFSGMASTGYVNSRRAIHCYHSLPLTRDALYLEGSAVQVLYYLASSLASLLIGTLVIVSQLGMTGESIGEGFLLILTGIGGYLLVFSLFQLAGTLTGTAVFRFIAAGIIAFLPVLVYLMIYVGAGAGMDNILVDYYMDYDHIRFLCPAFNIFYAMCMSFGEALINSNLVTIGYNLWSIATVYLTAAFYYLLGLWLHRKRRSELSESSLIWKKLTAFVKYPVIFVCGVGCAIFFRAALGSDISWMVFGGFCGLVLSFLLMNVLISRNTKRMFSGLPGLGITALVVALFLAALTFDVFGFNNYMYDADRVKSVTVHYGDKELTFTEEEEIAAVMPYITELTRNTEGRQNTPYDTQFMNDTAYYIDPAKVLNQSEKEAEDILTGRYPDRGLLVDENSDKPTFIWMGSKLLNDYYNSSNYEDEYTVETSAVRYYEGDAAVVATLSYDPSAGTDTVYGGDYSYDWDRLEVSVYPKFGIPIHRYMRVVEISENAAVFDVLRNSEQYIDSYKELAEVKTDELHSIFVDLLDDNASVYSGSYLMAGEGMLNEKALAQLQEYNALLEDLLTAASMLTPEMTDTPVIGSISVNSDTLNRTYNLYAGMTQFWDAWLRYWERMPEFMDNPDLKLGQSNSIKNYYDMLRYTNYKLYDSGEDIMEWAAGFYTDTYIIEADTGRALYVDEEKMAEVLEGGMGNYTLGLQDTRYMVVTYRYFTDAIKEGVENILADGRVPDGYHMYCFFRKDAVPQFVLDAFGK